MFGLPESTELNKRLSKEAIFTKFQMNNAQKEKFDAEVSRIRIIAEISPYSTNIAKGETVEAVFVLQVLLKQKDFSVSTVAQIAKFVDRNMLFVLEYEEKYKLAIYHTKLIQTDWMVFDDCTVMLKGLNLDAVWENLVRSIEGGEWSEKLSLEENIALHEKQAKLEKEIARLEKLARAEKQPKKKFEIVRKIKKLQEEIK